jgi:ferredoxin
MAEVRVVVDRSRCTGEGICVGIAPAVFELDDEGIAVVVDPEGAERETIIEAAESCPSAAITVVEPPA